MADRILASNDGPQKGYAYEVHAFSVYVNGNATADVTTAPVLAVPPQLAGRIVGAYLTHGENGADGTDPLFAELDVLINGTSIFTTKPKLDKTAGTGKRHTMAAATGVTVGVIDATKDDVVAGDLITATWDVTRTTPDT
jgi:hypothetical protein